MSEPVSWSPTARRIGLVAPGGWCTISAEGKRIGERSDSKSDAPQGVAGSSPVPSASNSRRPASASLLATCEQSSRSCALIVLILPKVLCEHDSIHVCRPTSEHPSTPTRIIAVVRATVTPRALPQAASASPSAGRPAIALAGMRKPLLFRVPQAPGPLVDFHGDEDRQRQADHRHPRLPIHRLGADNFLEKRRVHGCDVHQKCADRAAQ